MKESTIQELAMRTVEELQGMGLAVHTVWTEYGDAYRKDGSSYVAIHN